MAEIKKVTKKDNFLKLREIAESMERTDLVEFINHEIELITKKASKSSQTKTQKENETIKESIVNALREIGHPVTITELQEKNTDMATFSNQKISALLKQLVESGIVNKTTDKKKSYFGV